MLPEKQWEGMAADVEQNLADAMQKMNLHSGASDGEDDGEDQSSGADGDEDDDSEGGNILTADQELDFLFDASCEKNAERYSHRRQLLVVMQCIAKRLKIYSYSILAICTCAVHTVQAELTQAKVDHCKTKI